MNISNKKNKLIFSNYVNELKIKNVNISKYIIVYTDNCTVRLAIMGEYTHTNKTALFLWPKTQKCPQT